MGLRPWVIGIFLLLAISCGRAPEDAADAPLSVHDYQREVEQWRTQRLARLRAPDGWLSYTGSGRLRPGRYRVGSGRGNQILLPGGPARLGELNLGADGAATFVAAAGTDATVNGQPLRQLELLPAVAGEQEASRIVFGTAEFYLVRTGTVFGWRYRDSASSLRRRFRGIEHFPVQPQWRVVAQWRAFSTPQEVMLLTSIGTPLAVEVAGEAIFEIEGRQYRLQAVKQEAESAPAPLFFLFSDRTSGKETYGGARYLYAEVARDGRVVLDFNRAENPPCALTPHVVCPIAPPGNRLDLAVTAGEKIHLSAK